MEHDLTLWNEVVATKRQQIMEAGLEKMLNTHSVTDTRCSLHELQQKYSSKLPVDCLQRLESVVDWLEPFSTFLNAVFQPASSFVSAPIFVYEICRITSNADMEWVSYCYRGKPLSADGH